MPTRDQKISYKVWKSKDHRKIWNTRKHATLTHWDTHTNIVKFSKSDQIEWCSLWIYQYYQYKRVAVFRAGGFAVAWLNLPNPMDGLNCDLSMAWWNWNRIEIHCVVTDPECPWNWTKIHVQTSKEVNRLWLVVFFSSFFICSINETIPTNSFSYLQIAGLMRFFQVHWFIFCMAQKHCAQLLNCQMLMNECKTMNKCTIFVVLSFNACGTRKENDARRQRKKEQQTFSLKCQYNRCLTQNKQKHQRAPIYTMNRTF